MKNIFKSMMALLLVGVLMIGMAACSDNSATGTVGSGSDGYMVLEINPSVEFVLSGNLITEVRALNEDGRVLLVDEQFAGLTVEAASKRVVELAEQMGYLNESNRTVRVTLTVENSKTEEELMAQVQAGAEQGSDLAQVQKNENASDAAIAEELRQQNPDLYADITPAKVRMIRRVMSFDLTMTYERGARYSVSQLAEMLHDYFEAYEDMYDNLEDRYEDVYDRLKDEYELKILALYDEDLAEQYRTVKELEAALEELEDRVDAMGESELSAADLERVLELLGLTGTDAFGTDVRITPAVIERYMDRNFVPDYIEDRVEDIIERYESDFDEDHYILSAEDAKAFEALGRDVTGWSLEMLDDAIDDLEDRVEDRIDRIRPGSAHREEIQALRQEMSDEWQKCKNELRDEIQGIKDDLLKLKQELLANKG